MNKDFFIPDQWCAQEIYQIMLKHPTWIYSDGIDKSKLERYCFKSVDNIEDSVNKLLQIHGKGAKWAVLPDGPMVILRLK